LVSANQTEDDDDDNDKEYHGNGYVDEEIQVGCLNYRRAHWSNCANE
jgi:hypothetical protein